MVMQSQTNRAKQWIPLMLVFIGSLALASGLFVAVLTMTRTTNDDRGIQEPRHGVIYVGANTCFTCHKDQDHNWALLDNAQPVAHPQIAPVDVTVSQTIPQLTPGSTVPVLEAADQSTNPLYIITTENDQIRRADQWNVEHLKTKPHDWTAQCADCHTKPTGTTAPAGWRAQLG